MAKKYTFYIDFCRICFNNGVLGVQVSIASTPPLSVHYVHPSVHPSDHLKWSLQTLKLYSYKFLRQTVVPTLTLGVVGWCKGVVYLIWYLILAYIWARPAILVAGKGRGGMFLFLLFLHFHSCSFFFPLPLFHLFYFLSYLSSPFLWETTQNDPQGLMCR